MAVPAIGLDAAIMEPDTKESLFDMANIERATALKSRAFAYRGGGANLLRGNQLFSPFYI